MWLQSIKAPVVFDKLRVTLPIRIYLRRCVQEGGVGFGGYVHEGREGVLEGVLAGIFRKGVCYSYNPRLSLVGSDG